MRLHPKEVEKRRRIAQRVSDAYQRFPGVAAVFSWGSTASGHADGSSDVDVGVYVRTDPPDDAARRAALRGLADDPDAAVMIPFARLVASDKFWVDGVPVFVAWWDLNKERRFLRSRLTRLLDSLDDALAENEVGEIQRSRVLFDPEGVIEGLRRIISDRMTRLGPRLARERVDRARATIEEDLPRALACDDLVWAEECHRNALNELVRVVYYLNGRLLRRLKGVEDDMEGLDVKPADCSGRLRRIAGAPVAEALPELEALLAEVVGALLESEPAGPPQLNT